MGSLFFAGKRKALGINRTNGACLKEMFGPRLADWIGKRVVLYPTTTKMPKPGKHGLSDEPCIRVRGSPDIAADISFELRLPQRGAQMVALKATGKGKPTAAPAHDAYGVVIGPDEPPEGVELPTIPKRDPGSEG